MKKEIKVGSIVKLKSYDYGKKLIRYSGKRNWEPYYSFDYMTRGTWERYRDSFMEVSKCKDGCCVVVEMWNKENRYMGKRSIPKLLLMRVE